jgi:hypothetical protein
LFGEYAESRIKDHQHAKEYDQFNFSAMPLLTVCDSPGAASVAAFFHA